jgi:MFS family permease
VTSAGVVAGRVENSRSAASGTLAMFVLAHTLLAVDRSIMAIMLEPIRHEYDLSDTQLGLLTGIGFALFFGIAGLPLGWLVDRFNRRNILVASVATFSLMTIAAAATGSFVQLLVTRLLVGAGEAGGGPAMLSMLSDLFPARKRASAVATYYMGTPLGGMIILFAGGWIAATYGWRAVFIAAGVPGLLLALALMSVREPPRQTSTGGVSEAIPFRQALRFIWSQRALRHLLLTATITSAATSGLFSFAVSYFVRVQGATLAQGGMMMAAGYGLMGLVSTMLSGRIADRLAVRDERWRAWFCALACIATFPAVVFMVTAGSFGLAGLGLAGWALFSVASYGPLMALLQSLVTERMRGTVSAIFYLLSYFVGVSVGPQLVGLLSDRFSATQGERGLASAMIVAGGLYLWGAVHFLLAARTVRADLARAAAA